MKEDINSHYLLKPFSRRELLKSFLTAISAFGASNLIGEINSSQAIYQGWLNKFSSAKADIGISQSKQNSIIKSIAGYFSSDGYRHAIVAARSGKLYEIYYKNREIEIRHLACFNAINCLDSFFAANNGYQSQIVATGSGN